MISEMCRKQFPVRKDDAAAKTRNIFGTISELRGFFTVKSTLMPVKSGLGAESGTAMTSENRLERHYS